MQLRVRALIWREEDIYVAREIVTGVTSQGKTIEEALELYLEEVPEALEKPSELENSIVGVVEVSTKAPKVIGA